MNEFDKRIEILYKERFGQLISLILQRFRPLSIDWAEDIVQETFTAAALHWPKTGMPDNPSGWHYQTCKNKSINLLKQNAKTADLSLAKTATVAADEISEAGFKDAQLRMLMACCHPHLTPKTQIVLALKYVARFNARFNAQGNAVEPEHQDRSLWDNGFYNCLY
jgi:predicted RNA polymerase sigma factor